jgi:hypothetical protein
MRGFEHEVSGAVDVLPFSLCIITPQHKDEVFALARERCYCRVSKLLPTLPLV